MRLWRWAGGTGAAPVASAVSTPGAGAGAAAVAGASGVREISPSYQLAGYVQQELTALTIHAKAPHSSANSNDKAFSNLLISAELMLLNGAELIEAVSNVMAMAQNGARIFVGYPVPDTPDTPDTPRTYEQRGGIPIGRLISLFAGFGGKLLFHEPASDNFAGDFFVFEKVDRQSKSGIDSIQEIIVKDRKTATYKLALLRALTQLAKFETNLATYYHDGNKEMVCLPLKRVAFYWFKFYFPLLKSASPVKQMRSNNKLAFENILLQTFRGDDSLAEIISRYEDGANNNELDRVLRAHQANYLQWPHEACWRLALCNLSASQPARISDDDVGGQCTHSN